MSQSLTRAQAQEGAPQWRLLLGRLMLSVAFPDFASALRFVDAVGAVAEEQQHHPDIDLRWGRVVLAVASHDVGGLTDRDLRFAAAVTPLVADHGGTVEHPRLTELEIAVDTMDAARIIPFWAAVLGFVPDGEDAASDPEGRLPSLWFQRLDEPREQRNRIHLDVTVSHDEAEARVEAALAGGGTLVSDADAPRFWVLADADGNEACVCTWQGRDG
ncbi:pterin-4-alpha-carbinolamine dehydratase [Nostocoides sp. F2B08]|uniref:VOC family protein n=1 Tax=Nostocoides sp. F2B08 TaxID=2653936 RepID=UPI001263CEFA|nr:VOC family protein [Tetrasphaera sp. F2B08]KAB7743070.1 pterin-4-alpha-carbinolamine dehydratase [Tetrasphaera sp. F2B08]